MGLRATNRSSRDIYEISDDASLEDIISRTNDLIADYNNFTKFISIQSNFDGYIAENVVIPIASTVKIQHFLGVKPKWRIILRQVGNGVITDIPSEWTDKFITLRNNGAEEVTLSVFIARE